ncbi:hypothetical protein [Paenibacillus xylanexedens]|uniref:hypothetical protein n=1 Tax=Paenibacillus xylanexedens TaxID=528191 RepID=UPI00164397F3|nr:hypothetical protein [Paenibacillus xylanexedens]
MPFRISGALFQNCGSPLTSIWTACVVCDAETVVLLDSPNIGPAHRMNASKIRSVDE